MRTATLIYSSKYGQTREIAIYMRDRLITGGYSVYLHCIDGRGYSPELAPHSDFVIVGAPVYREKFSREIVNWVKQHRDELAKTKSAFFSVSLNAADNRMGCRLADKRIFARFIAKTEWTPQYLASLAGAIKYKEYNWLLRLMMKRISAAANGPVDTTKNHELTDWNLVEAFLKDVVDERPDSRFLAANVLPEILDKAGPSKDIHTRNEAIANLN